MGKPSRRDSPTTGILGRLFFTCWLVYLVLLNPAGNVMSNTILGATVSLAKWHSWLVPLRFPDEALDVSFVRFQTPQGIVIGAVSGFPPGASLAALPCYSIAWWMTRLFPGTWARPHLVKVDTSILIQSGIQLKPSYQFTTPPLIYWLQLIAAACVSAPAAAGVVVLCYLVLNRFGLPSWQRLGVSLTAGFGTSLFPQAGVYGKESLATFLVFAAFTLICFLSRASPPATQFRWLLYAGALAGGAISVEYKTGLIALLLMGYAARKMGPSGIGAMLCGLAGPLFFLGCYHTMFFGAPWLTPYQFRAIQPWSQHQVGLGGLTRPHLEALWGLSFSPFQGLFLYQAFLLVAMIGLLRRWDAEIADEITLSFATVFGLLLATSSAQSLLTWSGGFIGWGSRHLVPATPFMALLLAGFLRVVRSRTWKVLALALATLSVGIQLLCATWGGTLFPDARAPALIWVNNPEVLHVNPIAVMVHASLQRGFSIPLLRVYWSSEAAAAWGTLAVFLLILCVCWWMWSSVRVDHSSAVDEGARDEPSRP